MLMRVPNYNPLSLKYLGIEDTKTQNYRIFTIPTENSPQKYHFITSNSKFRKNHNQGGLTHNTSAPQISNSSSLDKSWRNPKSLAWKNESEASPWAVRCMGPRRSSGGPIMGGQAKPSSQWSGHTSGRQAPLHST